MKIGREHLIKLVKEEIVKSLKEAGTKKLGGMTAGKLINLLKQLEPNTIIMLEDGYARKAIRGIHKEVVYPDSSTAATAAEYYKSEKADARREGWTDEFAGQYGEPTEVVIISSRKK